MSINTPTGLIGLNLEGVKAFWMHPPVLFLILPITCKMPVLPGFLDIIAAPNTIEPLYSLRKTGRLIGFGIVILDISHPRPSLSYSQIPQNWWSGSDSKPTILVSVSFGGPPTPGLLPLQTTFVCPSTLPLHKPFIEKLLSRLLFTD
jgi:hypothetical protein